MVSGSCVQKTPNFREICFRYVSYTGKATCHPPSLIITGYAFEIGRFYGDSKYYFVNGGPRDGGSGKVHVNLSLITWREEKLHHYQFTY